MPHRFAVALQPVDARTHIERTADGGYPLATRRNKVLHGHARTADVVDVYERQRAVASRPASEHHRHAAFVEPFGERIVSMKRDHQDAVHVSGGQIAFQAGLVGGRLRRQ